MADLLTHAAAAVLIKALTGRQNTSVFLAGTLLPDLIGRAPGIALHLILFKGGIVRPFPTELAFFWEPAHLPVGMLLLAYALSLCFPVEGRRVLFANLLGGMLLHLGIDVCQDHLGVGYLLLFPFSFDTFELGWIGSEDSVYLAGPLAVLAGAMWWWTGRTTSAGPPPIKL